jgi:hypothetical protein
VKLERPAEQLAALGHVARLSLLRAVVQAGADGISTTDWLSRDGRELLAVALEHREPAASLRRASEETRNSNELVA